MSIVRSVLLGIAVGVALALAYQVAWMARRDRECARRGDHLVRASWQVHLCFATPKVRV